MYKKLALGISVVFQPLVIPTLMVVTLFYMVPEATVVPKGAKWAVLLLISFSTFMVPLLGLVGLRFSEVINSLQLPERKERIYPFALVSVFYSMTLVFFYWKLNIDQLLIVTLGLVTISLILLTLITIFGRSVLTRQRWEDGLQSFRFYQLDSIRNLCFIISY